jgi:hypothetical protein
MSWRPHEGGRRERVDLHSIGETGASQRDVILPSRKLSHPRQSLSLATSLSLGLVPCTQSIISVSPRANKYILTVAETNFLSKSIFYPQAKILDSNLEHAIAARVPASANMHHIFVCFAAELALWQLFASAPVV